MPESSRRARSSTRWLATVAALTTLVLGAGGATAARWSDASTIPGTSLSAGRLDLRVEGQDTVTGYAPLDVTGLVPGASIAAVLTVSNAGNVPLTYTVSTTGSNADGKGLFGALASKVTADTAVTASASGATCAGPALAGTPTLAPAASDQICVEFRLPLTAPASLRGSATDVTISVGSTVNNAWTDGGDVTGTQLTAVTPTAPVLSCGQAQLGSITLNWSAVSGATSYRIRSGPLGGSVQDVPAATHSVTFTGATGTATVQAIFGSTDWISTASSTLSYSALAGVLGTCS